MNKTFKAVVKEEQHETAELRDLTLDDLPDNDVLIQIDYSTLNYKDALAVSGRGKICRRSPMVCGIDLAGTVIESRDQRWQEGAQVVLNGYGLSETQWGGYSQFQRVSGDWLVSLPEQFDALTAMTIGTAGYTAMLCVHALQNHGVQPSDGQILVTGASGGVGSVAIMLLSALGYEVAAASGRTSTHDYLRSLGAKKIIDRHELDYAPRPLEKELWAAGIDSVGSNMLATMLAQTSYDGIVAACGLAGGIDLPGTVMPFILRGVTLRGIDSVMAPMNKRTKAWHDLAELLNKEELAKVATLKPMSAFPELALDLLEGRLHGRVVIDVNA